MPAAHICCGFGRKWVLSTASFIARRTIGNTGAMADVCEFRLRREVPAFAVQVMLPAAELKGCRFATPTADFPMPFFEGKSAVDLIAAEPLDFSVESRRGI